MLKEHDLFLKKAIFNFLDIFSRGFGGVKLDFLKIFQNFIFFFKNGHDGTWQYCKKQSHQK